MWENGQIYVDQNYIFLNMHIIKNYYNVEDHFTL